MKNIFYYTLVLFGLLAFNSCESDLDGVTYSGEAIPAKITSSLDESYSLKKAEANNLLSTVKFQKADFGYQAGVTYTLQADLEGKNFENAVDVASVAGNDTVDIVVSSLNKAVNNLIMQYGLKSEQPTKIELRIAASISDAVAPVYSNTLTTVVTPYEELETLYMIGTDFGGWIWNNKGVVKMTLVNGTTNIFWTVKYIKAGSEFKWNTIKDWGGDFYNLDTNTGFNSQGGNAIVSKDGLYMIYIDLQSKTTEIRIEPATIYGIGDAFGNWEEREFPFELTGTSVSITIPKTGNLRMYADLKGTKGDWWKREFNLYDGLIEYRGVGGDQDPVSVTAGQVVTLDFNTESGTIK